MENIESVPKKALKSWKKKNEVSEFSWTFNSRFNTFRSCVNFRVAIFKILDERIKGRSHNHLDCASLGVVNHVEFFSVQMSRCDGRNSFVCHRAESWKKPLDHGFVKRSVKISSVMTPLRVYKIISEATGASEIFHITHILKLIIRCLSTIVGKLIAASQGTHLTPTLCGLVEDYWGTQHPCATVELS